MAEVTYEPYEEWEKNIERLMGIEGKALDEEVIGRELRNPDFFTRFKENHPDQLVLLHFNGNARDPRYRREKFHPAHWIYFNGAGILTDVSAEEGVSEIKVSDASLFKMNVGRHNDRHEDIGLCELDGEGKPDWNRSEQVQLISVDLETNTITVKRGCFGTEAREFSAGSSYAAAHVHEGPWGQRNNLMWFYNHTTVCPLDQEGKSCNDRLVDDVVGYFLPGGELEAFDGLEFDVLYSTIPVGSPSPDSPRGPDADADGIADWGIIDGINTYSDGVIDFIKGVREGLGDDMLILADGHHERHQRCFGILNGIESEGWPDGSDHELNGWSGGINRHLFWIENSAEPGMTYVNHRWWIHNNMEATIPLNIERLVIAGGCLTGSAYSFSDRPEPEEGEEYYPIWDELVMGQDKRTGWLGRPLAEAACLVKEEEDLLGSISSGEFLDKLRSDNQEVSFTQEGSEIRVEGEKGESGIYGKKTVFIIKGLPCPTGDLTVYMTARGEPLKDYYPESGRIIRASVEGHEYPGEKYNWFMSWMNQEKFESVFYFPDLQTGEASLRIEVEGNEPFWISEIKVYAEPDVRVREFEYGAVLANPAPHPVVLKMNELFPGHEFRRLKGSSRQDPVTNNGTTVGTEVTLPAKDALFLVRQ